MKELLSVLIVILILCNCSDDDDPIFEGDVWLLKQSEVKDFGRKGYRKINGRLFIGDGCSSNSHCEKNTDITDLTPLRSISHIEGILIIDAYSLTTLDGLENLDYVSGVSIWSGITSLAPFSNIDSIGFIFLSDLNIQDLYGFHNLKYVQDAFTIHNCLSLQSLSELKMLDHVGELHLRNLHGLPNLAGLEMITTVAGEVDIDNNQNLHELSGLINLHQVGGALKIIWNDNLTTLAGLENIENIIGDIAVTRNPKLSDLCALVPVVTNGFGGKYDVYRNGYNPTREDLLTGMCSN